MNHWTALLGAAVALVGLIWEVVERARPKKQPHRPIDDLDPQTQALANMSDLPASVVAEWYTPDEEIEKSRWPLALAVAGAALAVLATLLDLG